MAKIKQLAIMRNVSFGMRDTSHPCMWFEVKMDEGSASFLMLSWEKAGQVIKDADIKDVKDFDGHACWVEVEDHHTVRFLGIAKL